MQWNTLLPKEAIEKTKAALEKNNFTVFIAENGDIAKEMVLNLIPECAEVMTATSVTADSIGLTKEINESGKYDAVKPKLMKMDRETEHDQMQKLGAAPNYIIGSIHAVTEDGNVLIASNSGSQLPGYAYGASHVIWVVGAQKIVKNLEQGMKRIYEYTLPLEAERAKKAYGAPGSFVSKLLIYNKEQTPNRVTIILINQVLGF